MKKLILLIHIFILTTVFYSCESNDATITDNTPVSTVPQLLSPGNNSTVATLEPSFDWVDLPNSNQYRLQLSLNPGFNSILLDTSGLTVSEFSLSGSSLNDSSSYYWRVNGINSSDTSGWSSPFSFSTSLESINATNKILIELFTNTSCIPCVEANTYLDEVFNLNGVTSNDANVVIIRYHTTLFAGDPFYLYNTSDQNARMSYYPNSAIVNPRTFLLGTYIGNFSAAAWTNKFNEKLAETRTYALKLTNTYDSLTRNGNIEVKIKQVSGPVLNDLVFHIVLTENYIQYNAPNGETHFDNTFRDFITPASGQAFTVSPGQTNVFANNPYSIAPVINQNNADIIVMVQAATSREVMATEIISVK
ncbi:MAG TPA: hypothetical protein PKD83_08335 [Ignavibacteria bacterium]|nr:hypothetical protein [Ignavibacteria bacterium]